MTEEEKTVVELKYKSKKISQMSDNEVSARSKALLLKIHVVTGWSIPASQELLSILTDQFEKKLRENYGDLNPDEIEFAFRNTGTTVEDWGKAMNLNLVDKVLIPYLNNRFKISETERMIAFKKERPNFNIESDIDWRGLIEEDYQLFLQGREFGIPSHYYKVLVKDKFFEPDIYKDKVTVGEENTTEQDAKAACVMLLFKLAQQKGYKNLYVRESTTNSAGDE